MASSVIIVFCTRSLSLSEVEKYVGVNIKNLPNNIDVDKICDFLNEQGVENHAKNNVKLGGHGNVDILELDTDVCIGLVTNIDNKVFLGRKIY